MAENACSLITTSIKNSCLNYQIQETPYSIYVTLRKTFIKSKPSVPSQESPVTPVKYFDSLQAKYEEAVIEHESCYKRINELEEKVENLHNSLDKVEEELSKNDNLVRQLDKDKKDLEISIEGIEKNFKKINKLLKVKETELNKILIENVSTTQELVEVKTKFDKLSAKVNTEAKNEARKNKKNSKKESIATLKSDPILHHFACNLCDVKLDTLKQLTTHLRMNHTKTSAAQTLGKEIEDKDVQTVETKVNESNDKGIETIEEIIEVKTGKFKKFKCFYCDKEIKSGQDLADHRAKCSETFIKFRQNIKPQPYLPASVPNYTQRILGLSFLSCEHCCWIVNSETELMSHKNICIMKPKVFKFS